MWTSSAAFGRLCVETLERRDAILAMEQPPSGGCVLKHHRILAYVRPSSSAAFGRLCVETRTLAARSSSGRSAAFGRLCVETSSGMSSSAMTCQPPSGGCVLKLKYSVFIFSLYFQPPSGGCVLKQYSMQEKYLMINSRLRAAVC